MTLNKITVKDKAGKPIGHASVEYWNQQDPAFGSNARFTDGEGTVTFGVGFPAGVQPSLEVRADGYGTFKAYILVDGSVRDVSTGATIGNVPDLVITLPFA